MLAVDSAVVDRGVRTFLEATPTGDPPGAPVTPSEAGTRIDICGPEWYAVLKYFIMSRVAWMEMSRL